MQPQSRHLPADQRRAVTVEAVIDLAAEQNPADISTTAIASRMGVTQGALFRHFPNKDAIFEATISWVEKHLLGRVDKAAAAATSPLAALEAMFLAHAGFVVRHPGVPRLLFGELQRPGDTLPKKMVRHLLGQYSGRLRQQLEAGVKQGELDPALDVDAAASMYIGLVQGLAMQSLVAGDMSSVRGAAPKIFAIYQRGIKRSKS